MTTFLTRISTRATEVLTSVGEQDMVEYSHLIQKIVEVNGMGARIVKEYADILAFTYTKKLSLAQILEEAFFNALLMGHTYVGTEHLLLAVLTGSDYAKTDAIRTEVEKVNSLPVLLKNLKTGGKNSYLFTHGQDLTRKYNFYSKEKLVERKELDKLFTILLQKHNPNVLLVGDEGSGKTTLVETLAQKIARMDAPRDFMGAHVVEFSYSGFVSSIPSNVSAYDNALKDLATEVLDMNNIILVIRRLPNVLMLSAFRQFIEFLNSAGARFVVCSEGDMEADDLLAVFSVVAVEEPDKKVVLAILKLEAKKLEKFFLTKIPDDLLNYVYDKAKSEIQDQVFPQKGIFLLDKACSTAAFAETKVPVPLKKLMDKHALTESKMNHMLAKRSYDKAGLLSESLKTLQLKVKETYAQTPLNMRPPTQADVDKALREYKAEDDKEYKVGTKKLSDLEKRLNQKVIGQEKAVSVVAKALVRSQMGLRPKNKPVGNFLFLGPTGVGKTELAKVLAHEAFGESALIRLDMSDFSEKHTVARLVGAPPGYIGYNEGGELTSKIARKPQSVVLFDEIEKAHPEVMNILLQIMEEGQLSDMRGDSYDFSKAVIILTSNLGTDIIHKRDIGYGGGKKSSTEVEERVLQSVKSYIKPELLNRFDEIVTFSQLDKADSVKILDLLLTEVYASLTEKGIAFKADPQVKEFLLDKGFSSEFGARALRRTVEKELLDKIASFLLDAGSTGDRFGTKAEAKVKANANANASNKVKGRDKDMNKDKDKDKDTKVKDRQADAVVKKENSTISVFVQKGELVVKG